MDNDSVSSSSLESSYDETDDDSKSSVAEDYDAITRSIRQDNVACFGHPMEESHYDQQIRQWVRQVPIGLGLCPWAGKSQSKGNLRCVTCQMDKPEQVMKVVYSEMERLISTASSSNEENDEDGTDDCWKYATTLLICPFVNEWTENFEAFEKFVNNGCLISKTKGELEEEYQQRMQCFRDKRLHFQNLITLVPFHPNFLRWRDLPKGMIVGTTVQSYWGMVGSKSTTKAKAIIVETENKVFGRQKVKIRFQEELEGRRLEQYVPIDWIVDGPEEGPPLPDNAMHRAPYPTIHLISNQDLASLSIRDISRVKRKNAQRMMKLGWEGVQKAIEK